jgi:hypothetical protein
VATPWKITKIYVGIFAIKISNELKRRFTKYVERPAGGMM